MAADISNWRIAPHNIWAFQNVEKVLAIEVIRKSRSSSSRFASKSHSFDDFKLQLGDRSFDLPTFLAATNTDGIIVLHKAAKVFERYFNDNDAASRHICMSITKSVTGLLIGILAQQGKIDVNAPVKKYVPDVSKLYDGVTVQHCLDMRSGVKHPDDTHAYRAAAGFNPLRGDEPAKNLRDFLKQVDAPTEGPGAGFYYASVNTDLLGRVAEEAAGGRKKFAELISELIWQPMGAESDGLMVVDSEGNARAAGGLCATVADMARLGKLIADSGRDIVPSAWIEDMMHGGDAEVFAQGAFGPAFSGDFDSLAYRSCWYTDKETDTFVALGMHGQTLLVDRRHDIVIAKTSSQPNPSDFGMISMTLNGFREFRRILEKQMCA